MVAIIPYLGIKKRGVCSPYSGLRSYQMAGLHSGSIGYNSGSILSAQINVGTRTEHLFTKRSRFLRFLHFPATAIHRYASLAHLLLLRSKYELSFSWDFYLFPGIFAFLLLSYYNPRRWSAWQSAGSARRIIQYCLIIILSVYVCWGGESLSFIVISSLTVWFACRMRNKLYIPGICWLGYMGAISGATMLFAAPALASRSKIDATARALDVFSMNCDQLKEFVANLSLEKINLLKGSSGIIVLDGIPLWQHVYFLPHLITKYSICSAYILLTIGILLIMLLTNQKKTRRQHLYIIITGISISLLGACAYLYSCIPTSMSFAPATFTLIAVISYIYWNCEIQKNTLTIISGIVACICMIHLIPAGIEAWIYKPYEKQRFTEIHSQKSAGAQHLILPAPYPEAPRDSLGLISRSDLKEDPKAYPNVIASDKLHVKSISQHPCPPRAQVKP